MPESILFNIPLVTGNEITNYQNILNKKKFSGDGEFTKKCNHWIEKKFKINKALLTTSCTHALEMAALLINTKPGDEIIMPSFTFVSSANPFILRGAKIIFVDVRPDTMNIDENLIEEAISKNTKAIVCVHYAGVACEMNAIMLIARKYNLYVIEDAAQGVMANYKGQSLGSIGHIGCFSFHETKNYHCGEGGAILINDNSFAKRAEIIREKGTNRSQYLRGMIEKYTWVDIGSSYLPSELNAAFLYSQFEIADKVNQKRLTLWNEYFKILSNFDKVDIQNIPVEANHNAHIFYIKLKDIDERKRIIEHLKEYNIESAFHYIPLHEAKNIKKFNFFMKKDIYTTKESNRLLRLPLHYNLEISDVNYICTKIIEFFDD